MRKSITVASFTIVELIAVIAIISVLTGLLLAGVAKVRASAKIKKAKATMEQLEAALEMYSQNWGDYPADEGPSAGNKFTRCSELINALESETSQAKAKGGPYVKYANELKATSGPASGSLLDPWGKPYIYHWKPPTGGTLINVTAIGQSNSSTNITFNIWSSGPNQINNEWSPDQSQGSTYPEPSPSSLQKSYSDDIVNW